MGRALSVSDQALQGCTETCGPPAREKNIIIVPIEHGASSLRCSDGGAEAVHRQGAGLLRAVPVQVSVRGALLAPVHPARDRIRVIICIHNHISSVPHSNGDRAGRLFKRCLLDCCDVDLYTQYLRFIKDSKAGTPTFREHMVGLVCGRVRG